MVGCRVIITLLVLVGSCRAQSALWKSSVVILSASEVADIASSARPGLYENTAFLRGPNGGIDVGKAVAVKGSLVAVMAIVEWVMTRHHPERAKIFSTINFNAAEYVSSDAAQNMRIH